MQSVLSRVIRRQAAKLQCAQRTAADESTPFCLENKNLG
jgi:hypothetical protein